MPCKTYKTILLFLNDNHVPIISLLRPVCKANRALQQGKHAQEDSIVPEILTTRISIPRALHSSASGRSTDDVIVEVWTVHTARGKYDCLEIRKCLVQAAGGMLIRITSGRGKSLSRWNSVLKCDCAEAFEESNFLLVRC